MLPTYKGQLLVRDGATGTRNAEIMNVDIVSLCPRCPRSPLCMDVRSLQFYKYLDDIKMSRRRAKEYDNVDYTKLAATDNGFIDAQFVSPPEKVPWKAVVFAGILLIVGSTLLVLGSLVVSGHIDVKYSDRMWPMIILGILMFIPGAYHVRIAYYAYKEVPGYSFDDIPEFD